MKTKKSKPIAIRTFDPGKGKAVHVGKIIDGVFVRKVGNAHFMVKENGYGLQSDVLESLVGYNPNCKIQIITKNGTVHNTDLPTWVNKGRFKDYSHGGQVFLDIKYMVISKGI